MRTRPRTMGHGPQTTAIAMVHRVSSIVCLLPALWTIPTADPTIAGRATHYSPGLMETVAANRGISLEGHAGGVALNRAGDLRRTVWLEWRDGSIEGPFLVVDCAQRDHFAAREDTRLIVEVDYQTADARGFAGIAPVSVTVHFLPPACSIAPCGRPKADDHPDPVGAQ